MEGVAYNVVKIVAVKILTLIFWSRRKLEKLQARTRLEAMTCAILCCTFFYHLNLVINPTNDDLKLCRDICI